MTDLPTGTVTFLFTDIEGSSTLWEQHRDVMRPALIRHDALVEQIVAQYHGQVVRPRGEGDSRFAVFARATDAVAAAARLQQALHAEVWPTPTPLLVRMALHTGEAAALQAQIAQLIKQGRTSLVLDLAELEYISSGGIRVLMDARKRARAAKPRGDLRLAGAGERIKAVLALTCLTTYFQSYDDLAEAVGSF